MIGKWIDENFDNLVKEYNIFMSSKIVNLYSKNAYYITHPVLSRNIHSSNHFNYFCRYKYDKKFPKKVSLYEKIKKITKYYIKSFLHFFFFLVHFFIFKIAYKKNKKFLNKNIVLIDTFTMIDKIYPDGFKDNYFGDLFWKILENGKKDFAILSVLFGDKPYNLRRRFLTYKLLEKDKKFFLSEFELLAFIDYVRIFYFILVYPFFHLKCKENIEKNNVDKIYNISIDETLDVPQWHNYMRYLFGKKIGKYFKSIKLITWDENQVIHKLLNKGLRDSKNKNITIYGTKFFGFTKQWLSLVNIKSEIEANVSPDIIVLKGNYYKQFYYDIKYKIGYAPRENYLLKLEINKNQCKNNIGVLFGYDIKENELIISSLNQITINKNILYRLHPNHKLNKPFKIPKSWVEHSKDLIDFSYQCNTIISAGTGAAFELMCMGNYIIIVGNMDSATVITLPDEYKNFNWDVFYSKEELINLIEKEKKFKQIDLNFFFEQISEKKIKNSLGL